MEELRKFKGFKVLQMAVAIIQKAYKYDVVSGIGNKFIKCNFCGADVRQELGAMNMIHAPGCIVQYASELWDAN